MRHLLLASVFLVPSLGFAAGSSDPTPPTPTSTTTECQEGMIWDEKTSACVAPQESLLDDETLYNAAREFAYAGQYNNALVALSAMTDPLDDRVLTYKGFAHRKAGDVDLGMAYYQQAIARNPDNLLARSYMGQAFVEQGNMSAAKSELVQIIQRGGRGSWPAFSLRSAIRNGAGYSY
jgi:tetratricopeptide (TPR) repeat protein